MNVLVQGTLKFFSDNLKHLLLKWVSGHLLPTLEGEAERDDNAIAVINEMKSKLVKAKLKKEKKDRLTEGGAASLHNYEAPAPPAGGSSSSSSSSSSAAAVVPDASGDVEMGMPEEEEELGGNDVFEDDLGIDM